MCLSDVSQSVVLSGAPLATLGGAEKATAERVAALVRACAGTIHAARDFG